MTGNPNEPHINRNDNEVVEEFLYPGDIIRCERRKRQNFNSRRRGDEKHRPGFTPRLQGRDYALITIEIPDQDVAVEYHARDRFSNPFMRLSHSARIAVNSLIGFGLFPRNIPAACFQESGTPPRRGGE